MAFWYFNHGDYRRDRKVAARLTQAEGAGRDAAGSSRGVGRKRAANAGLSREVSGVDFSTTIPPPRGLTR